MVSNELIRVAIQWHELWQEAIDEAFRFMFALRNVDAAIATLAPLHEMMRRPPQTFREVCDHVSNQTSRRLKLKLL